MDSLQQDGYRIYRGIFGLAQIRELRAEADRVANVAGKVCVRNLRTHSTLFAGLSECDALRSLLAPNLIPVRSILFDKCDGANWPVAWHRDLTICVASQPDTLVPGYGPWSVKDGVPHVQAPLSLLREMRTLRVHLDATGSDNAALKVIPRSHRSQIETSSGAPAMDQAGSISCECAAGDVLAMSPLIQHSSPRAQRNARRRVLHFEYAPADSLPASLHWGERQAVAAY